MSCDLWAGPMQIYVRIRSDFQLFEFPPFCLTLKEQQLQVGHEYQAELSFSSTEQWVNLGRPYERRLVVNATFFFQSCTNEFYQSWIWSMMFFVHSITCKVKIYENTLRLVTWKDMFFSFNLFVGKQKSSCKSPKVVCHGPFKLRTKQMYYQEVIFSEVFSYSFIIHHGRLTCNL